jgi:hypothetical protein
MTVETLQSITIFGFDVIASFDLVPFISHGGGSTVGQNNLVLFDVIDLGHHT